MDAYRAPRTPTRTDLSPAIARALGRFTRAQAEWAESTTQDAVESVRRIPWLHQVRAGVRVPVEVLYTHSAQRLAEHEVRRFVDGQAGSVGRALGLPPHAVRRIAWEVLRQAPVGPAPTDPRIHRAWTEPEVPWRRRFERSVRTEIRTQGTLRLQDWLEATLRGVVAAWDRAARERVAPAIAAR